MMFRNSGTQVIFCFWNPFRHLAIDNPPRTFFFLHVEYDPIAPFIGNIDIVHKSIAF